jgi:hypothetical protein
MCRCPTQAHAIDIKPKIPPPNPNRRGGQNGKSPSRPLADIGFKTLVKQRIVHTLHASSAISHSEECLARRSRPRQCRPASERWIALTEAQPGVPFEGLIESRKPSSKDPQAESARATRAAVAARHLVRDSVNPTKYSPPLPSP